jgi:hypothetical protein
MQNSPEFREYFHITSQAISSMMDYLSDNQIEEISELSTKASNREIDFDPMLRMMNMHYELAELKISTSKANLIKQRDSFIIACAHALAFCRHYVHASEPENAWLFVSQANYHLGRAQLIVQWENANIEQQQNTIRAKRAASMRHGKRVQREKDVVLNKMKEHAPKEGWASRKKMFADIKASLKQALQDEFGELTPSDIDAACDRIQNSFSRWMRTDPVFKDSFNSHMKNKVTLPYPKQ